MLVSILMQVLVIAATLIITLIAGCVISIAALFYMDGNLGWAIREQLGWNPPEPQIRVIGPGGPEDIIMEGEATGVKSVLSQIPREQRQGWRIERIES